MRMLARVACSFLFAVLILIPNISYSQTDNQQGNIDFIFVVDLSASMKQGGLFERVKQALEGYISTLRIGDRAIIYGFDSDVTIIDDVQIQNEAQKDAIIQNIRKLQANGQWTYTTKAIDLLGKRLADLQQARDRYKQAYILTDGKNDPPPNVKDDLSQLIQVGQLIERYKGIFEQKDTFIYFIHFGAIDGQTKSDIARISPKIKVEEIPPGAERPIPPSIAIAPAKISLGEFPQAEVLEKEIIFEVVNIQGSQDIKLNALVLEPQDAAVSLTCGPVVLKNAGQTFKSILSVRNGASKLYEFHVRPVLEDVKAVVMPASIPLSFTLSTPVRKDAEIVLAPEALDLGTIPIHRAGEKTFTLQVAALNNADQEMDLVLSFELLAEGDAAKVSPRLQAQSGTISSPGQKFEAVLTIAKPSAGSFTFKIIPKLIGGSAAVRPAAISVTCSIAEPKFMVTTNELGTMARDDTQELQISIAAESTFAGKPCTIELAPDDAWREYLSLEPRAGKFTLDTEGRATFTTQVKALKSLPWLKKAGFKILIDDPQEFGVKVPGTMPLAAKIALAALGLLVAFGLYLLLPVPSPPVGYYLVHLERENRDLERARWHLLDEHKKKFRSRKLAVSGDLQVDCLSSGSFELIVKDNGVYLKSNKEITDAAGGAIDTKSGHLLDVDEVFIIDKEAFKYTC